MTEEQKAKTLTANGWQRCKCGCAKWTHPSKRWFGWCDIDTALSCQVEVDGQDVSI